MQYAKLSMIIHSNIKISSYGFYYFTGNNKVIIKHHAETLKNIPVSGIDAEHPVTWLQFFFRQTHMDWHSSPYVGKGHFVQFGWNP